MGMGGHCHTPAALPPGERDPVPIVWEAGWPPVPVWTGEENLAPAGIRSPDLLVRSESLYRLCIRKDYSSQNAAVCQGRAVTKSIDTISQGTQHEK